MTTILKKLLIPLFLVLIFSCRKDSFSTDPSIRLYSSVDTVHFDTVFTTTGSATQSFKIINDNAQGINISSVRLAGGTSSPFNINVDGITGPQINNIDINANDSAYVFKLLNQMLHHRFFCKVILSSGIGNWQPAPK